MRSAGVVPGVSSKEMPEPEQLATDAIAELLGAVEELNAVLALLENGEKK